MDITIETSSCKLGRIVTAACNNELFFVGFGDEDWPIIYELLWRFNARLQSGKAWMKEVLAVLNDEIVNDIPLMLLGTDFQKSVWNELCKIERGDTKTYSDIAAGIGRPTAQRAVATACGANPLALLIPCHRAIGMNYLGGYRWGIDRKEKLLAFEKN